MEDRQRRHPVVRIFQVPRARPWLVNIPSPLPKPKSGSLSPLFIIYGFAAVILLGTLLLWLPISSKDGSFADPVDALFTATSAVCVTGLVVKNTGTYWSSFGQGVILALIQIGGFGIMTIVTLSLLTVGRRIGLRQKLLIGESMGVNRLGGLTELVRGIAIFSIACEVVGAALLYLFFSDGSSTGTAAWRSIFTAVSAFNNAGFDVFGVDENGNTSMMLYQNHASLLLVIAALVILGGISFIVVADVFKVRRFNRLALDTKIVLVTTAFLLAVGTVVILITEYSRDGTLGQMSVPTKLVNALFMSVTPRTAGFTSLNMGAAAEYTVFFVVALMFIGGAAGSTAGGIKVNTFGMLAATIWSTLRGKEHPGAFEREFKVQAILRALALVMIAIGVIAIVVLVLTMTEDPKVWEIECPSPQSSFIRIIFETVSAFGTVGLSTGITPYLTGAGKGMIIATMFIGRLGPLALALALIQRQRPALYRHPEESVRIG